MSCTPITHLPNHWPSSRDMGVPGPRAKPALVILNGRFLGVFNTVEEIDKHWARARFPSSSDGNIYKDLWPLSFNNPIVRRPIEEDAQLRPQLPVRPNAARESLRGDDEYVQNASVSHFLEFSERMLWISSQTGTTVDGAG